MSLLSWIFIFDVSGAFGNLPWKKGAYSTNHWQCTQNSKFSVSDCSALYIAAADAFLHIVIIATYIGFGAWGYATQHHGWLFVSLVFCPHRSGDAKYRPIRCDSTRLVLLVMSTKTWKEAYRGPPCCATKTIWSGKPRLEIMEVSIIYQTLSPLWLT